MHEHLKVGYFDLSMFQPGVGDEPIRVLPIPDQMPQGEDEILAAFGGNH